MRMWGKPTCRGFACFHPHQPESKRQTTDQAVLSHRLRDQGRIRAHRPHHVLLPLSLSPPTGTCMVDQELQETLLSGSSRSRTTSAAYQLRDSPWDVNVSVTLRTEGQEILTGIIPLMAPAPKVVNLQVRKRATRLTPPTVPL